MLLTRDVSAGVIVTNLHSFEGFLNGEYPYAAMVHGSDGYFYGTTEQGGTNGGYGTVFRINTNGALASLYSFTGGDDGANPTSTLAQGSDGSFYGTSEYGGTNNLGTVFKITTNGTLTSLYSFPYGGNDGVGPEAGLVQGNDGNFYGTTVYGGTNGKGTVFKITTSGALTTLYTFGTVTNAEGESLDGVNPRAALVEGSDGYFYGTTAGGGTNSAGTVFKISPSGTLTPLVSVTGSPTALVEGNDGYFYGTTVAGGLYECGSVFKMSTNGVLTALYSFGTIHDNFGDAFDGAGPSPLVQGSDGYFYGTTSSGGANGYAAGTFGDGTVFKISTNGVLTTLYSFGAVQGPFGDLLDGEFPGGEDGYEGGLVQGNDGYFYGTTYEGGTNGASGGLDQGYGTVFKISTNGTLARLYSFQGDHDGGFPGAGLVQGSDGCFYGTTPRGGTNGDNGTVFKISTNGVLTSLYSFGGIKGSYFFYGYNFIIPLDGAYPNAALVQRSDGFFYGTTGGGGTYSDGTVFKISTNGTLTSLYSFTGGNDGSSPGGLVEGSDGNFYGTTEGGYGTVFKISTNGTLTSLHSFTDENDGGFPEAALVQGSDGCFYGTTWAGGETNDAGEGEGTVFRITATGALTTLYAFTSGIDGAAPNAALVEGSDGYLYGAINRGGTYDQGTVLKISTNGTVTLLYTFTGRDDGGLPSGLVQASDGYFYGTTAGGGFSGYGTVFRISTNGTMTSLYSFFSVDDVSGFVSGLSPLAQGSDGNFYGTASSGGKGGTGAVFRLTVLPTLQITTTNLPNGAQGNGYSQLLQAVGGVAPYAWSLSPNLHDLPAGLTLTTNGVISGTPINSGTNSFTVDVTDAASSTASQLLTLIVIAQGSLEVAITPAAVNTNGPLWQVDGGIYQNSGVTVNNLSKGAHVVSFKVVSKWNTPTNQSVTITSGGTTTATGVYTVTETAKPTLTITSPKSGESVTGSNDALIVTGTTMDKESVTNVYYQFNGGSWTSATPSNSWSNWTASVTLSNGANTISAYALDISGNFSTTNKVHFKFFPSDTLVVVVPPSENGEVTPNDNGKVLGLGTNFTLTAVPGHNWIFSNWVVSGSANFVSNNPVLKFKMQSNLVLQANFVTNVFLAAQGNYHGLFAPTNGPRQQTNSGAITFSVTGVGVLSGKLTIGSSTPSLKGQFNPAGFVTIITSPKDESSLTTTLQLDFTNQTVSGTVTDGSFIAELNGNRDVFTILSRASKFEGQYTLIIPGANDPAIGPAGTSYGTVKVDDLGNITLAGSLADGTAISQSSVVSQDGAWPLYVSIYGGQGSLWGSNYFVNHTLTNGTALSWINATNSSKTAVYRAGFTNPAATLTGGLYISTNTLPTDMIATLQGGNLPFGITNGVTITANDKITLTNKLDATNKLTLTITKSTGLISGSFANPADPKDTIKVSGVVLERPGQTNVQGYFLGTNQSGTFKIIPQ